MALRSAAGTPRPYLTLMLIWVSTYQVRFAGGSHWAASLSDLTSLSPRVGVVRAQASAVDRIAGKARCRASFQSLIGWMPVACQASWPRTL